MKKTSLYIHIPFCESKCYYCDFLSFKKDSINIKRYIDNIILELSLYREKLNKHRIHSIFIGGGTPSCIDGEHIHRILKYIEDNFNLQELVETTIEVNPGTLDRKKVEIYKAAGIDRVSMGMQSFDKDILKSIGRIHDTDDFYNSYNLLIDAGIYNINVDLILGLPGQRKENIINDLNKLTALGIKHISYYGLILEDGTKLKKMYLNNEISIPEEDLEREMYHSAVEFLKEKGYKHYEISNFSLPGFHCRHNMMYWNINPYVGVGLGSHSNIDDKRYWNEDDMIKYNESLKQKKLPIKGEEKIDLNTQISEYSIMGLRLIDGIDIEEFRDRFDLNFKDLYGKAIDKHIKDGLLLEDKSRIYLSSKGLDLANMVEVDFIL